MQNDAKLIVVKVIHTLIWIFFNFVIFYMLYAVIQDKIDIWLWIGYGLIFLEGITLLIFRFFCPLTLIARKYSDSTKDNFDIYLPNWLAKYTKLIYTSIMVVIIILTVYRLLTMSAIANKGSSATLRRCMDRLSYDRAVESASEGSELRRYEPLSESPASGDFDA